MPLRDHFHGPAARQASWEGVHSLWPGIIVRHLFQVLPDRYTAEPRVHLGPEIEVDVASYDSGDVPPSAGAVADGVALQLSPPSIAVETDLLDTAEYAVRVFDTERGRRLVAAVEIVSPANKDREGHRETFVGKCRALLREGVSVSIVDMVGARHFNLYDELLKLIGQSDPTMGEKPPPTYAASCRWREQGGRHVLESWSHVLRIGAALPTLPLWLGGDVHVPLALEESYEETCRLLRIG